MIKQKNICDICVALNCDFRKSIRKVCHFAMLHFNYRLPLNCFIDCLDFKYCLERYNYNPTQFKCTGMKLPEPFKPLQDTTRIVNRPLTTGQLHQKEWMNQK